MKKQKWMLIPFAALLMISCGSEEGEESEKELTFDEKVQEVCDCFNEKAENGEPPKDCFMLQGEHEQTVGEDRRVEFIQATNACAG